MTRWIVAGLIVLNVLLGIGVYLRLGGERSARAQIGGGRGEYATVAGYSGNQAIVYIMEPNTGKLIALKVDPVARRVDPAAAKNVALDLQR